MKRSSTLSRVGVMVLFCSAVIGCNRNQTTTVGSDPSATIGGPPPLAPGAPAAAEPDIRPYAARRATFQTKLVSPGPSPQAFEQETPPEGVREIAYSSGDLALKAWVHIPEGKEMTKNPALVCFHGGFAFGASDLQDCQPFMDAGFVVMTPWLRGENGLPGNFETFYGELDDAVAAIKWLSEQPFVDANRIYAFGHSSGGVLSALLSLIPNIPLRYSGSAGGLYGVDIFDNISAERVAFDKSNPIERQLRVLPGNIAWMAREHYAYVGEGDTGMAGGLAAAERDMSLGDVSFLEIIKIPGDHQSSYPTAMKQFLELVTKNP